MDVGQDSEKLKELGVDLYSQSALEATIENDAQQLIKDQSLQQEVKRLERAQNAYNKVKTQLQLLRRKLNNATRISAKAKLREQIQELTTGELKTAKADITDIQERIADLHADADLKDSNDVSGGRRPNESERDFLVRTGKITAFGSKNEFVVDNATKLVESEEQSQDDDYVLANEQMDLNQQSSDDDIYLSEENIEDGSSSKIKPTKDDGDETHYQRRLKHWIRQRSKGRPANKTTDALPEWRLPHPLIPDAKLNDDFKIPGDIFSLLFNYQKTGVQWLYELFQQKCGGIIGDEMGLGKTIQVIAFLASLHHSGMLNGPVLIVAPATVLRQWCNEFNHWWPPLRTIILHSMGSGMSHKRDIPEEELENLIMNSTPGEFSYDDLSSSKLKSQLQAGRSIDGLIDRIVSNGHVLITTYVGLRTHSDKLLKVNWQYAVLDEGHKIRNPDADISLTCKKLKTHNRIILSGTPIQNNLVELWSLFDFIYPGKLGTLPVFQQQFVVPINSGGYANATNMQVQTGYKCAVALRDLISPYLLRRMKVDVAKDLPKKNEMVLFCKLTQVQRQKYLEFLNSQELSQIRKGRRQVLYGIDILRKICNHPDLLEKDTKRNSRSYGDPKRSGKMQVVKQLLLLWKKEGHKTLLFTQSRQMLDILEEFISFKDPDLENLNYLRMDGTTTISLRQSLIDQFNHENYDIFLLTTRVGGLGVNLTGANRIIIFDPDWNPSTDMQARERAWRIGQKREVSIYRLMVAGSIEEKIYHRQIFKQFLTNKILSDPKQKRFFKMNELHDLFTLGGDNGHTVEELEMEVREQTDNLKNSKTEEGDDFDAVVSLEGVSKLESFYNGKEKKTQAQNEEDRLMDGLLSQSTIEGVVTHDNIVQSHTHKSSDILAKEAERNAQQALDALRRSRKTTKKYAIGTPTWTGRFGQAGKINKRKKFSTSFPQSSADILAKLSSKKQTDVSKSNQDEEEAPSSKANQEILRQIQTYLNKKDDHFATSAEVIHSLNVSLQEKEDVIKVRALLRSIASFDKDKRGWILNKEFQT